MPRSTKGQIQMGEAIAVLIIFMVLLFAGIAWYSVSQQNETTLLSAEQYRLELLEVSKEALHMPELRCSFAANKDESCVDLTRVQALQRLTNPANTGIYNADVDQTYRERFQALRREGAGYGLDIIHIYPQLYRPDGYIQQDLTTVTPLDLQQRTTGITPIFTYHPPGYDPANGEFDDVYIPIVLRDDTNMVSQLAIMRVRQYKVGVFA